MLAILGGLGAAVSWATATICASRSSRMIGPASALAWVMLSGFIGLLVPALLSQPDGEVPFGAYVALVVSAVSYLLGLQLTYRALRIGRVAIVAPIVSTEGALAALLSILLGESVTVALALTIGAIAVGVAMASMEPSAPADAMTPGDPAAPRRAALLAIAGAASFAVGLVAIARAAAELPATWVILAPRLLAVVVLVMPLVVTRRLRLTRAAAPLVIAAGIGEVTGGLAFAAGAQWSIAVAAILASQFATLASAAAFILFRERLARIQVAGVAVVVAGVAALGVLRA